MTSFIFFIRHPFCEVPFSTIWLRTYLLAEKFSSTEFICGHTFLMLMVVSIYGGCSNILSPSLSLSICLTVSESHANSRQCASKKCSLSSVFLSWWRSLDMRLWIPNFHFCCLPVGVLETAKGFFLVIWYVLLCFYYESSFCLPSSSASQWSML